MPTLARSWNLWPRAAAVVWTVFAAAGCGDRAGGSHAAEVVPIEIEGRTYQLPAAVLNAEPAVRDAYLFALAHPEVLTYMPCYCGCESLGHRSNLDCFVDRILPDGTVHVDDMGFG